MNKRQIKKIAEGLGWSITIDKKDYLLSQYSEAGQDFHIEIEAESVEDFIKQLNERCEDYDCSEEASLWLDGMGHGTNGAPYDMKDVYKDMENCLEMMEDLYKALV